MDFVVSAKVKFMGRILLSGNICAFILCGNCTITDQKNVVFVSLHSYTSLAYSLDYVGPAIDLAVKEADKLYRPRINISLVTMNRTKLRTCPELETETQSFLADFYWTKRKPTDVMAVLAPGCSSSVVLLGDLAREWNLPIITAAGTDAVLDSRKRFPTLLRLLPYQQGPLALFTVRLLAHFNWTDVAVICDDKAVESNFYALICSTLTDVLPFERTIRSVLPVHYNFRLGRQFHRHFLAEASRVSRVFIIITQAQRLREVLVEAASLGMANGEYMFMAYEPFPSPAFGTLSWKNGDPDDVLAKQGFDNLLVISTLLEHPDEEDDLDSLIIFQSATVYNKIYEKHETVSPFVHGYYQGVMIMAKIFEEKFGNFSSGDDLHRNPSAVAWDRTFKTPIGKVLLNSNGDKNNEYVVRVLYDPDQGLFELSMGWNATEGQFIFHNNQKTLWNSSRPVPVNRPLCGFTNKECRGSDLLSVRDLVLISLGTVAAFVGCMTLMIVWIGRYYFLKKLKSETNWLIESHELKPLFSTSHPFSESINSSAATGSLKYRPRLQSSTANSKSTHRKNTKGSLRTDDTTLSRIRDYRGVPVWISVHDGVPGLRLLTSLTVVAINLRRSLRHPNIVHVIGLSFGADHITVVTDYFRKGSLDQLLSTGESWIDAAFQYSLLADIANGMIYIHNSSVKVHGALNCLNCMITGQLGIKLTDFGLPFLYKDRVKNALLEENYDCLIWTAPEVLREPKHVTTREADVYSFGIMMHEILCTADPYQVPGSRDTLTSNQRKELVRSLIADIQGSVRPPYQLTSQPIAVTLLMESCWHMDPLKRPTFLAALHIINNQTGIYKGYSYVDMVIGRLEKYAEDLETQVSERTITLLEEKRRTESLLMDILPETIAKDLLAGRQVDSEMFASTTVAFTEVWGFALITSIQTPLQIVDLLNDLYSTLDELLAKYDVYKIETIKDSYMLASGVPKRNGDEHATQVGLACCGIMRAVRRKTFGGISVNLREGIHSGQLAGGIIGQRLPRYCLFGDTVNIASRMMTTSEPQKIHISPTVRSIILHSPLFEIVSRGLIDIKGKGKMETYWLESKLRQSHDPVPNKVTVGRLASLSSIS